MEDQDKLRQMRSQDVLKQPNTSSFQDGMDQYQKPTDTKILYAINKLTYARDSDREFDDGTFVEALDTALACMRQMRSEPCEWCDGKEDSLIVWTKDPCESEWDDREYTTRGWTWKELKPKHCPNCGRKLVK